jgi:hypothetical protein
VRGLNLYLVTKANVRQKHSNLHIETGDRLGSS